MLGNIRVLGILLSIFAFVAPSISRGAEKTNNDRVVKAGMMVSVEYTVKGTDGKVIDTSKGKGPLVYRHGQKAIIPGLERELEGMKVGDEKHITIKPEDGYGKVDPKAYQEVAKEKIPPNGLKVGAVLVSKTEDGQIRPMRIKQIKEKTVVMDVNHPLAGKTLIFDVKIVDIQPVASSPAQPAKPASPAQPAKPSAPGKK